MEETSRYVTLAKVGSIPPGQAASFVIEDHIIAIFNDSGTHFALNDICPHMGASLAEGHFADGVVTCPWHAWRFRVDDGTWCDNPVIKTDSYVVRIVGDEIQVRLPSEDIDSET